MPPPDRSHLLTIAVEDYFDATAVNPLVPARHKDRMDPRVVENTERALELLRRHGQRATFFVLGRVAEKHPEILTRIFEQGHEVACKGYDHKPLREYDPVSFEADARRTKAAAEAALGRRALGFRVAEGSIGRHNLWMLDVLAKVGFLYDSSVYPRFWTRGRYRFPFEHETHYGSIGEFPLSTLGFGGFVIPMAGGNYFRQLPSGIPEFAFALWNRRYASPFNMYFHVWELDPELPRIATATALTQLRQYRNIDRMPSLLARYLSTYRFTGIADPQRWDQEPIRDDFAPVSVRRQAPLPELPGGKREDLSIIIPMFNETKVLGYLDNALKEVLLAFAPRYNVKFVLVDDCSTDDNWTKMQERFGERPDFQLVRHEKNQGVAGAILTGIRAAKTELVCSMDADCTYDPRQLHLLLEKLAPDVAMVTASPYHALGKVVGVPSWRLFLSRNLSRLYARMLRHSFATYTACFRAYRKSRVEHVRLVNTGFLGVAELLVRLDIAGENLIECPATLEVRLLGVSKLKTARTIREHLRLLARIPALKREHHALQLSAPAPR